MLTGTAKILGFVSITVVAAFASWVAGSQIQSPGDKARAQSPPAPGLVTVPIEKRVLESSIVTRATFEYGDSVQVKSIRAATSSDTVTKNSPEPGTVLTEGTVAMEVNGRPTFIFEGELPTFRDLVPGLDGDDIRQLERALKRIGTYTGAIDGHYGTSVQQAVKDLYLKFGYVPIPPSSSAVIAVTDARRQVESTRIGFDQAKRALQSASAGPKRSERLRLEADVKQAAIDLATARNAAEVAVTDAAQLVAHTKSAAVAARMFSDAAQATASIARTGVDPDTGLPITLTRLADLLKVAADAADAAINADQALVKAQAVEDATPATQSNIVTAAEVRLTIAQQISAEAIAPQDLAGLVASLTVAEESAKEASKVLNEALGAVGIVFPQAEFFFLRSLPRKVITSSALRGDGVPNIVMTLASDELLAQASVAVADRVYVKQGMSVRLDDVNRGLAVTGKVSYVSDYSELVPCSGGGKGSSAGGTALPSGTAYDGTTNQDGRFCVLITPDKSFLTSAGPTIVGLNLRLTIPVRSTESSVTVVPISTVWTRADGSSLIDVELLDNSTKSIPVRTGLEADGYIEVHGLAGELNVKWRVIVGQHVAAAPESSIGPGTK